MDSLGHYTVYALEGRAGEVRWHLTPKDFQFNPAFSPVCYKYTCGIVLFGYAPMGNVHLPYRREKGPMGGAPYIGPRLGDGLIFEVSVSLLGAKERPGKLPTRSSYLNSCGYY